LVFCRAPIATRLILPVALFNLVRRIGGQPGSGHVASSPPLPRYGIGRLRPWDRPFFQRCSASPLQYRQAGPVPQPTSSMLLASRMQVTTLTRGARRPTPTSRLLRPRPENPIASPRSHSRARRQAAGPYHQHKCARCVGGCRSITWTLAPCHKLRLAAANVLLSGTG
jgi:hypothetical protein